MSAGRRWQVTDRDRRILNWIGRHGIVTAEQVARRFFRQPDGRISTRQAHRRMQALAGMKLVEATPAPYWGAPGIHRLTAAGARAGNSGLRPARLVERELRHALALVDLVETLVEAYPEAELRTERELRSDRMANRHEDRQLIGLGRCPDALLIFPSDKTLAVELDLTQKTSKEYARLLDAYQHELFDRVWWYVPPGTVGLLTRVIAANNVTNFVDVFPWPRATDQPST